ncbi:MAG: CusA/CzcA family heavy metal efflux RND transporter [Gemmataceae bacterium]|nr:CusA/CzcA family heavy metal efflux RND transporter [Gemmataceae bacterium]
MLNAIIKLALRHRPLVVALCLVALGYGGYLATRMPIDVFPDLDRPRVVVMTEAQGLAPEEVETLVTYPLESALLGATGVQDVRSQSGFGLSVVYVEFGWSVDIRTARQTVQERLTTVAGDLPDGVRPQMAPISSIMGQIMITGMRRQPGPTGGELSAVPGTPYYAERVPPPDGGEPGLSVWKPTDRRDPAAWEAVPVAAVAWQPPAADGSQTVRATVGGQSREIVFPSELQRNLGLRTLADWVVRPRLLKITGIAQVITMGGGRKQYQVLVDPVKLAEYGVTLRDVEEALRANNVNHTGGYSVAGGTETPIRVIGRLGPDVQQVAADLRMITVKPPDRQEPGKPLGRPVLLKDVARVTEGAQVKRGDSSINGYPAVALTISKQPHVDTRALTDAVKAALRDVEGSLPPDVVVETELYQVRDFIDRGVYNVGEALVVGAVLVLIILFLFLLNVRTTFISLTAIPLSLVLTVLVFKLVGLITGVELSINVMTLGGIAVAMGELVDDAIVDVENIYRRLGENSHAAAPKPALRVIYEASVEIRSAIVFGTALVILVFLPLFALSGIEGRLFTPLGVAYIVSILASLVVSICVTPVLSYYLLGRSAAAHHHGDGLLLRVLKWLGAHLIRFSVRRQVVIQLFTWLLVGYCAWRVTTIGADFLPPFDEGNVQVNVTLPSGASLDASNQAAALVDAKLRSLQKSPANPDGEVLAFLRRTGRAEMDEHAEPPNANEFVVVINPESGKGRKEIIKLLQSEVKNEVPGVDVEVEQPLAHLISHMISGSTAQIAIKLYGDDMDTLEKLANQIKAAIAGVPGISSLAVEPMRKVDEVHVKLRPEALAFYGVDRAAVGNFVQVALNGQVVSQVVEGQRRFDLLVRLEEPYRADIANLGDLRLDLPGGREQVRLSDLADITPPTGGDAGANQVKRDNVRRRIVIRCNALGRDLQGVVTDIRRNITQDVPLPEGYFVEYGGQFESQERATRLIAVLAAMSLVGMFFVLYMLFPSGRIVAQILIAVPTAFIGGVLALVISGQTLTVASLVGFISLGGIAARNGILLVTHYLHLMRHEGETFDEKMVLRGSLERLSPVLMTALTAGIALIPLVVVGQEPGREILYPVATVILGGLITSTFCEFLIRPGLFLRFSGTSAMALVHADETADGLDADPSPSAGAAPAHDTRPPPVAAGDDTRPGHGP